MANNSSATFLDDLHENPVFWKAIFLVESFLVCFGNSLSIVVFWRRRRSLKRTSYLLINLAVADLSLGIGVALKAGVTLCTSNRTISDYVVYITSSIITLTTYASIFSLTFVSLETAYAMVFPFRHRTTGPRPYCFAVILVWLLATVILVFLHVRSLSDHTFTVTSITVALSAVCPILISSSYLLIWWVVSKRSNTPIRERDQRKKLAVTLFVVTVFSLTTWIPGQVAFLRQFWNPATEAGQDSKTVLILFAVLLSNSFFNPLVYTFRLPEFRKEIKLIICKLSCCKMETRAAASSPPPCNLVSMAIIDSAHEMRVLRSSCAFQQRNDNNANELQFQDENMDPEFINETGLQENARIANE